MSPVDHGIRFEKLEVTGFKGVSEASLSFGPGLNILYGPNDLGKSTLAEAIRCALLLPVTSTHADTLLPWQGAGSAKVELTLRMRDARYLRVSKTFGPDARESRLSQSPTGEAFNNYKNGREVDEYLRETLELGIAGPGRGGPKGVPESFLSNVLLAEQTRVDAILSQSLAKDTTEDGKLKLKAVLAALGEDPRVKRMLDLAQTEVDRYFTATGRKKGGKSSPFTSVAQRLTQAEKRASELRQQANDAESKREALTSLQHEYDDAARRVEEAKERLQATKEAAAKARALAAAQSVVDEAQRGVDEVEQAEQRAAELEQQAEAAAKALNDASRTVEATQQDLNAAREALHAAEKALDDLTSEGAGGRQALEEARLDRALLNAKHELDRADLQLEEARRAMAASAAAATAEREARESRDKLEGAWTGIETSRQEKSRLEEALEAAERLERLARLEQLSERLEAVGLDIAALGKARAAAHRLHSEIAEVDRSLAKLGAPDDALLEEVRGAVNAVELARAKASSGLQVLVERLRAVGLSATQDDGPPLESAPAADKVTYEAGRSLRLAVGDLAVVDIVAGLPADRDALAEAEATARQVAEPVFARASVDGFDALVEVCRERVRLEDRRRELRGQLASEQQRADDLSSRAEDPAAIQQQIESMRTHVGTATREELEAQVGDRGSTEDLRRELQTASAAVSQYEQAYAALKAETAAKEQGSQEKRDQARVLTDRLGGTPEALVPQLEGRVAELEGEMKRLSDEREQATHALGEMKREAELQVNAARNAFHAKEGALQEASELRDRALGDLKATERAHREAVEHAAGMNRAERAQRLVNAKVALEALPEPAHEWSDEQLEHAENEFEAAKLALNDKKGLIDQTRGALEHTGGLVVAERLEEAMQVVEALQQEQEDLEIEAEASRLLFQALNDAREQSSNHLGSLLAQPVAQRFSALTAQRYAKLELDSALATSGVVVAGSTRETDALSVGTREQLATLLRLVIAERLCAPIILDDHLVQADHTRLTWFRDVLLDVSSKTQVFVITCRGQDYGLESAAKEEQPVMDKAGGTIRSINLAHVIKRWTPERAETT